MGVFVPRQKRLDEWLAEYGYSVSGGLSLTGTGIMAGTAIRQQLPPAASAALLTAGGLYLYQDVMRCVTRKQKRNLKLDGNLSMGAGACFIIASVTLVNWPLVVVGMLCAAAGFVRQQPQTGEFIENKEKKIVRRLAANIKALEGMPMAQSSALLNLAIPFNLGAAITQCPWPATVAIVSLSLMGNYAAGKSDKRHEQRGFTYH